MKIKKLGPLSPFEVNYELSTFGAVDYNFSITGLEFDTDTSMSDSNEGSAGLRGKSCCNGGIVPEPQIGNRPKQADKDLAVWSSSLTTEFTPTFHPTTEVSDKFVTPRPFLPPSVDILNANMASNAFSTMMICHVLTKILFFST